MNTPVIASPQVTNHILHRFKLRADKKLGQNFLIDENIVRRIVEVAELSPADKVLEVGPGIGTLTQGLAESGADVVAVELDKCLLPVLDVTLEGYDNVRIVNGDILQVNIMETVAAPFCSLIRSALIQYFKILQWPISKNRFSKYFTFLHIGIGPVSSIIGVIPVISHYKIAVIRHFKGLRSCSYRPCLFKIILL